MRYWFKNVSLSMYLESLRKKELITRPIKNSKLTNQYTKKVHIKTRNRLRGKI